MKRIIVLFLFASTFCFSQEGNYRQLDNLLELLSSKNKAMGSFAIMKEGKLVYNKTIGYQYKTNKVEKLATSASKYRIGSITKTFTATLIFQLLDEKKIQLDDKLALYFPEIPNAKKITITHLLTHSSGLFNITEEKDFSTWMLQPITHKQMLDRIKSHEVIFQPGEKNAYSNTNFIVLGYILEKIENKSYKTLLKERITDRLNLKNTYYGDSIVTNTGECQSYYYKKEGLKQATETDMSNPGGAGGIVSTPGDLTAFMSGLFNGELISTTSLAQLTKTSGGDGICSGIMSMEREGQMVFGHGGGIDGFKSFAMYVPDTKTAIAITLNASNYGTQPIAFNLFDAASGKTITLPNFDRIQLTEEDVKTYEGIYESTALPFDLIFKASGTTLKGGPNPKQLNKLAATKKDEFTLDDMGVILKFDRENNTVLFNDQASGPIVFTKKQ